MEAPAQFIHEKRIEFSKNIKVLLEKYGRLLSSEKELCRFEYKSHLSSESFLEKSNSKINLDKIYCTFITNSKTRGSRAAEIVPKAAVPKAPFGLPSGGVLVRLNASARNSARHRSVIARVLPAMKSTVR